MKTTSLDALIGRHIGKVGIKRRDEFENELRLDIIGETIKRAGKELRMPNAWQNYTALIFAFYNRCGIQ